MLNLNEIILQFPPYLHDQKRSLLREYLQYKILEIIFDSKYANKLSFLGGTALRIIYNNSRFSEDLDFDNFNLTKADFEDLSLIIKNVLRKEGFEVEVRNVFKSAFRAYIKIPDILFQNQISPYKNEVLLIQIDTVPHYFDYKADRKLINKFGIFTEINVTPLSILLAQKIYAAFQRKRTQGRDFYDIVFLMSFNVNPDFVYLKRAIDVENKAELKKYILEKSKSLDFSKLAFDFEDFLFNKRDTKRVLLFVEYMKSVL
ncbi:hypothetical protein A2335_00155 [Candidatus Peregrinibacteria bacterium RIFOXYB2_FULL_32_7]|nr:MAG: hypothetical protein A2335_00155 [Candidatus Peregrinibacteria bacterium RIFOXYB2_FULL_32_7]